MKVYVSKDAQHLGAEAAAFSASVIRRAIQEKGYSRIVLSTGASQFETLEALVHENVDWSKVEMFHLDEYINLPSDHPASFIKYLKERFVTRINLKQVHFVRGEGDIQQTIEELTREVRKEPIDLALIGIGENAHIAFNDPPADFDTKEAYIIVNLDEKCKQQQVGEGWFPTIEDVPKQAISMSVYQIMQSKTIVSCVPHRTKAKAIQLTFTNDVTNEIPSTMLKTHHDWSLYIDQESASLVDAQTLLSLSKNDEVHGEIKTLK